MDHRAITQLIPELYALVERLERAAPGRSFTPDGHLLGSIGEVIAASRYGLELAAASTKGADSYSSDRRPVEIKCTGGGGGIAIRGEAPESPDLHLLVLSIAKDGTALTIYNGPAVPVWEEAGPMQSNGQRPISLSALKRIQATIPASQQLPELG
jgi:hypothetical protein